MSIGTRPAEGPSLRAGEHADLYREHCYDAEGNRFTVLMIVDEDTARGVEYALEDGTPVVPAEPGRFLIPETGKFIARRDEPDAGT